MTTTTTVGGTRPADTLPGTDPVPAGAPSEPVPGGNLDPQAVPTGQPLPGGDAFKRTDPLLLRVGKEPIDPMELFLMLAEVERTYTAGVSELLKSYQGTSRERLDENLRKVHDMFKKMRKALKKAKSAKTLGHVMKAVSFVVAAAAFIAAAAAIVATGGVAAAPTTLLIMAAVSLLATGFAGAAVASDISQEVGGPDTSVTSGLKAAGLTEADAQILQAGLSADIGSLAASLEQKYGTMTAEERMVLGLVLGVVGGLLMGAASAKATTSGITKVGERASEAAEVASRATAREAARGAADAAQRQAILEAGDVASREAGKTAAKQAIDEAWKTYMGQLTKYTTRTQLAGTGAASGAGTAKGGIDIERAPLEQEIAEDRADVTLYDAAIKLLNELRSQASGDLRESQLHLQKINDDAAHAVRRLKETLDVGVESLRSRGATA